MDALYKILQSGGYVNQKRIINDVGGVLNENPVFKSSKYLYPNYPPTDGFDILITLKAKDPLTNKSVYVRFKVFIPIYYPQWHPECSIDIPPKYSLTKSPLWDEFGHLQVDYISHWNANSNLYYLVQEIKNILIWSPFEPQQSYLSSSIPIPAVDRNRLLSDVKQKLSEYFSKEVQNKKEEFKDLTKEERPLKEAKTKIIKGNEDLSKQIEELTNIRNLYQKKSDSLNQSAQNLYSSQGNADITPNDYIVGNNEWAKQMIDAYAAKQAYDVLFFKLNDLSQKNQKSIIDYIFMQGKNQYVSIILQRKIMNLQQSQGKTNQTINPITPQRPNQLPNIIPMYPQNRIQ
ncbi:hypothetical protein WA158_002445 [Blastocystis sp. Blastoise]